MRQKNNLKSIVYSTCLPHVDFVFLTRILNRTSICSGHILLMIVSKWSTFYFPRLKEGRRVYYNFFLLWRRFPVNAPVNFSVSVFLAVILHVSPENICVNLIGVSFRRVFLFGPPKNRVSIFSSEDSHRLWVPYSVLFRD